MEDKKTFKTIDEYILQFPLEIQKTLKKLRLVIKEAAPEADEKISYQMPTFSFYGNLVHFAVWKNHIGFYPTSSGMNAFKQELSEYKRTKGSIHFPLSKPLPYELISRIVKFRVAENMKKAQEKLVDKK
ncbi:hypothetical protein AN964_24785 [Heyndrickxia shackletonii]|uniref:YdhG-like domain-containing protein n=1 Tax=Heyndrickxia shackletonii TaxID=157838 RepID=A0A0Q3WSB3_9BACI|nr:DUF1801 domain-containing protein [Heyndrickxia shackletonii]KQL50836.1 hypothetical protein AN964_24785 [Heyndrickxia shackletonii]NEY99802.1 hypothetical protein [Heyndrickxia shackletonii]